VDISEIELDHEFIKTLNLNEKQLEACLYFSSPLLILAGAGTGKTKTLMSKIAVLIRGGIPASRILAITFTNKASQEMLNRISKLVPDAYGLWCMTFHSFGARFLRMHYNLANLSRDFVIYDEDDQKKLITSVIKELGFENQENKASIYLNIISRAKDELLDSQSYLLNARLSNNEERIKAAQIYYEYQKKLEISNAVDFGDLLLKPINILNSNKELLEYYQNYFRYILVDEYQDTNKAQYFLIKLLSSKHRNLCVVGDPDQSIYGWRGADIRNILQFESDFKDAKIIILDQNYRSTSKILDCANRVIKHNKKRKEKNLWTNNPEGEKIELIEALNEIEEANIIVRKIKELIKKGYTFRNIAVFYRTNAQSRNFEEAFLKNSIPYKLIGTVRFYDRKEIKDAISYLKLIINPRDMVSILRVINTPARGIGQTTIEKITNFANLKGIPLYDALLLDELPVSHGIKENIRKFVSLIEEFREKKKNNPPHIIAKEILIKSGYWESLEEEAIKNDPEAISRLGNLNELINAIRQFEDESKKKATAPTLEKYLEEISLKTTVDEMNENDNSVTLMTVHLAKGLEFDVVFLTGLEENLFPINAANSDNDELEEERRLCYVGMTRARKKLYMSWAQTRRVFGKTYPNMMSRFIIEANITEISKPQKEITFIEASPLKERKISVGRKVIHPVFGKGTVLEIIGSGEFSKIKIRFDNGAIHTFMLKYAPIEVI
jgi:DNA helicase-2/ATP-dependent DNA helicase PcrA